MVLVSRWQIPLALVGLLSPAPSSAAPSPAGSSRTAPRVALRLFAGYGTTTDEWTRDGGRWEEVAADPRRLAAGVAIAGLWRRLQAGLTGTITGDAYESVILDARLGAIAGVRHEATRLLHVDLVLEGGLHFLDDVATTSADFRLPYLGARFGLSGRAGDRVLLGLWFTGLLDIPREWTVGETQYRAGGGALFTCFALGFEL
jgi:hypothetical protein